MARKISGAALRSALVRQIKEEWLNGYGIPWDQYTVRMDGSAARDVTVEIVFTHKESGCQLRVSNIWFGPKGEINQAGSNYGDLTL